MTDYEIPVYDPEIELQNKKTALAEKLISNPHLIQRELNNRSFYQFLLWAWPVLSSHEFMDNWHIKYLCDILQEMVERVGDFKPKLYDLLINIPPGSTKTIICSIALPVWCWTRWPWMRFITASYSSVLSLESADFSRDLIKSTQFQEVYPELIIKTDKDSKSNYKIAVKKPSKVNRRRFTEEIGGYRYSTSVGGTLTGYHGDVIIWDDPMNPQQTYSDLQLIIANRWIDQTLPTRKTNKENTITIGIMQRLHQNDPSGHLLAKKKDNLKHISIPGEIRNYKEYVRPHNLVKYYKNDLFDPKRLGWKVLEELETDLGQYGFAGQIGQNPTPAGGGMFKVDFFQMVSEVFHKKDYIRTVRYWDKSASTTKRSPYTVGVKMSRMRDGSFLIEDVKRGRWGTDERERVIKATAIADGDDVVVIVEQEPGSAGKDSADATVTNLAGFSVVKDRVTGDKITRADPYSVQVNNGNVKMRIAEWNGKFKEEHSLFPFSTFKDQVDASSGAFGYLTRKKSVRVLR